MLPLVRLFCVVSYFLPIHVCLLNDSVCILGLVVMMVMDALRIWEGRGIEEVMPESPAVGLLENPRQRRYE